MRNAQFETRTNLQGQRNHKLWKRFGYKFPHTTTKDQTFYRDQLAAFVGLGYLQTYKLKELLN